MKNNYDVIVVGAGHAGVEAANISDKLNQATALISFSEKDIASLPCNVSIGGSAKGIVVKEIFALGGLMPLAADETQLQTKILNQSKGPAVRALRAQIDKVKYPKFITNYIKTKTDIDLIEAEVTSLIINNNEVNGVILSDGTEIFAKKTIIAAGTFLRAKTMKGMNVISEGPDGKKTNETISQQLENLDINLKRLKTGTPPRIITSSINFEKMQEVPGSYEPIYFTENLEIKKCFQNISAYLAYTNIKTHNVINNNIEKSYLYSEEITGTGPRYCPSIEDKVKRFADKSRHQIFLEIESEELDTTYLAGVSSSMPKEVQESLIKTISGFENAIFEKYAYAIEYDVIDPKQLQQTLELKKLKNLYFAGQINGTSGYEEAAAQGLVAGVNVVNSIENRKQFILDRNESYIGVLIDDITTKGITDPYRLLTSRAEYRLLLRNDNAVERLHEKAYINNLISKERYTEIRTRLKNIEMIKKSLWDVRFKKSLKDFMDLLIEKDIDINVESIPAIDILKRPEFSIEELDKMLIDELPLYAQLSEIEKQKLSIEIKFEGYINKQEREVLKYKRLQNLELGNNFDYANINNLALEAREKLANFKPLTVYQASRISGVNPSDIIILIQYVNAKEK